MLPPRRFECLCRDARAVHRPTP